MSEGIPEGAEEAYTKDPIEARVTFTKLIKSDPLTWAVFLTGTISGMLGMFGWIVFNKFLAHLL